MRKIVLITLALCTVYSCSKDEKGVPLATPTLDWNPTSVSGGMLEISITINSDEDLPQGSLEFTVDDSRINTFKVRKGTNAHNTAYRFDDLETHRATLFYTFSDGRSAISKTINIKKSVQQVTQKSSKSDWVDF